MKRPPQPKYRSFYDCPFPIRPYAYRAYSEKFIQFFLQQIEVCRHGWLCRKCCFYYRGKVEYNYPGHTWHFPPLLDKEVVHYFQRTHPEVVRATPSAMMWRLFYPARPVTTVCREPLCVNLDHIVPSKYGGEALNPWQFMQQFPERLKSQYS